jgi:hypothetical protein
MLIHISHYKWFDYAVCTLYSNNRNKLVNKTKEISESNRANNLGIF